MIAIAYFLFYTAKYKGISTLNYMSWAHKIIAPDEWSWVVWIKN